jgi:hypothetical protein
MDQNRRMTRRHGALVALIVTIALALGLMWRVYVHHKRSEHRDEPAVVAIPALSDFA